MRILNIGDLADPVAVHSRHCKLDESLAARTLLPTSLYQAVDRGHIECCFVLDSTSSTNSC